MKQLYPFQQEAVGFLRSKPRSILALDTGLGKTACAVRAAKEAQVSRVLIVAPAFLRLNWAAEVDTWGSGAKCKVIKKLSDIEKWGSEMFAVCSYDFCATAGRADALSKCGVDILICDEAHYLRNWSAQRTKNVIFKLACNSGGVWFLSATPIVKSAGDLHPLLSAIKPGAFGKYTAFCESYCEKKWDPFVRKGFQRGDWKYVGIKEEARAGLQKVVGGVSFVRSKAEVMSQLPARVTHTVPLEVSVKTPEHMDEAEIFNAILNGAVTESYAAVRREIGLSKVPACAEFVSNFTSPSVVFCHHVDVVNGVSEELDKRGLRVGVIIGGQSEAARMEVVRDFESGELDVVVASIGAAGVGITLNAAEQCVFCELPWTYTEYKQCEDRIGRIGADHTCVVTYRLVSGSVDETIVRALESRKEMAGSAGFVV